MRRKSYAQVKREHLVPTMSLVPGPEFHVKLSDGRMSTETFCYEGALMKCTKLPGSYPKKARS